MAFDDAKTITDLYLTGKGEVLFETDVNNFMSEGGGRFAVGRQFEIVNQFFTADSIALPPGTYTKNQIVEIFGFDPKTDYYGWTMNQYNFQDNKDDYLERTYIYNTMSFKIKDTATFIVDADGQRRIEDYAIEPNISEKDPENFDFVGGNLATNLLNGGLRQFIDPYREGETVEIDFTGERETTTYDGQDYFNDLLLMNSWQGMNPAKLYSDLSDFIKEMRDEGIILDASELPSRVHYPLTYAFDNFLDAVANSLRKVDPLIIDLGKDGLELNNWENSNVHFDLNSDGIKEQTGWVKSAAQGGDEAFLAIDKNNNGNIDSVDELFGNSVTTGFDMLRSFDSNHDNRIDSNDSQFGLFKLWKDANANGVVDSGELTTLTENNITSLSLSTVHKTQNLQGNVRTEYAAVTFANGTTAAMHEVLFGINSFNSVLGDADRALGPDFKLDASAIFLPQSRGYGTLHSWTVAMTKDGALKEMAEELVQLSPMEYPTIQEKFEQFMFRWAGVEDATVDSVYREWIPTDFDPRKMAFLETITGQDFLHPNHLNIAPAEEAWELFYNTFLTRFLVQGTFKDVFPDATYDMVTDNLILNATLDQAIARITAHSSSLDQNSFLNYAYFAETVLQLNKDQFNDPAFDTKVASMVNSIVGSVTVSGFAFTGIFNVGTGEGDTLYGSEKADIIKGLESGDTLYGDNGDDYLEGGKGDDFLRGDAGNDIYRFAIGDGKDVIEDLSGTDKILFGPGITQASLTFVQVGKDLVINVGQTGDQIGIKNFYNGTTSRVETLSFADGTQMNLANLGTLFSGTDFGDTLNGSANNDVMDGKQGNDVINGNAGDDWLTGGKGNDTLDGSTHNDSYFFRTGDGQDVVFDYQGADRIVFGPGITQTDITLVPDVAHNNSLIIKIGQNGDQIAIRDFFFSSWDNARKIETLEFADGSKIDLSKALSLTGQNENGEIIKATTYNDTLTGAAGNDSLYGYSGNDLLEGGRGNDYIDGDNGNDTYIFKAGDGQDTLFDVNGTDTILFGAGITKADITLIPDMAHGTNFIIKVGENGDQITLSQFFASLNNDRKIEKLAFADGSQIDFGQGVFISDAIANGNYLFGTLSNDTLEGSSGNDRLDGSYGNDTYLFHKGDGQDTITDYEGTDRLLFDASITRAEVQLLPDIANNQLIVKIGTNGDQVVFENFFKYWNNDRKIESIVFADGSQIDLSRGLNISDATANANSLRGTQFNDTLEGSSGNDTIDGYYGNDTYLFAKGDGQDTIWDYTGVDTILFGANVEKADITLISDLKNNNSLIIKVGKDGDQITLPDFFAFGTNDRKIESLTFADGSKIDLSNGVNLTGHNPAGETIRGTIYADTLEGYTGNDTLEGQQGNDTYRFGLGSGQDTVYDYEGVDRILFGSGITQNDITLVPDVAHNNSLIIKVGTAGDQITLNQFFAYFNNDRKIETLEFADGSKIALNNGINITGQDPNGETILGTLYNDTLSGSSGNDYLEGDQGNDTYRFALGGGKDTLYDYKGTDRILFGSGITKNDITLVSDIAHNNSLIIKVGTAGDQIALNQFFAYSNNDRKIETLEFADGSTINLANGISITGQNTDGESLRGTDYSDTLSGSSGNDTLEAGKANDIYQFNSGGGQDVVFDTQGADKILFGANVTPDMLVMESQGSDLLLKLQDSSDQLTISRFFEGTTYRVETLEFSNGTVIDITKSITVEGSNADDTLIGTPFTDLLTGNNGNDYLYGGSSSDTLDGGAGNDSLKGGTESDTYRFQAGFGSDTLSDTGGTADTLVLGTGLSSDSIALLKEGNNLVLLQKGASDSVTLAGFFGATANRVEYLQFATGEKFNLTNVQSGGGATAYSVNGYGIAYEDTGTLITLLNGDDRSNDYSTILSLGTASHGTALLDSAGRIFYTASANYYGADSFSCTYKDSAGVTQTKQITLDVRPVNDNPAVESFSATLQEDAKIDLFPLSHATDVDTGDVLGISRVSTPQHGKVSLDGGKLSYTPVANFYGNDSFTYTVTDGHGGSAQETISLTVMSVNDSPVAHNDISQAQEDQTAILTITGNDNDVEDGFFGQSAIHIVKGPAHGSVEIKQDGSIYYTPTTDYFGTDSFEYQLTDSGGATSNVATATIDVEKVNDAPKILQDQRLSFREDTGHSFALESVFYDPEGDSFKAVSATSEHGVLTLGNGSLSYLSSSNYNGTDHLTVTLEDSYGARSTLELDARVEAVNDTPVAQDDTLMVLEDTETALTVLSNDSDVEDVLFARNISDFSAPLHGTLTLSEVDGTLTYKPAANFAGTDSFTYTVTDAGGASSSATVNLTITNINDAPTGVILDAENVEENAVGAVIGRLSVVDPDQNDTHRYTLSDNRFEVVQGFLKLKDGISLNFETDPRTTLTVTATDSGGVSYTENLTFMTQNVNEAPNALSLTASLVQENAAGAIIGQVVAQDPDANDTHHFTVEDARFEIVNGMLKVKDGVSLDFETAAEVLLRITATDAGGLTRTEEKLLYVENVNEAPTLLTLLSSVVDENAAGAAIGRVTVQDPDAQDTHRFALSDNRFDVVDGMLILKQCINLDFETEQQIQLSVTATDAGGLTRTEQFALAVQDKNDAPTALTLDNLTLIEKREGAIVGKVNVLDPDMQDAHSFRVSDNRFEVIDSTLKLKEGISLIFAETPELSVSVTATDTGGLSHTENYVLQVESTNRAPTALTLDHLDVTENSQGSTIGKLSVIDPDQGDTHRFTVSDERFEIIDGTLKLKDGVSLNFETEPTPPLLITATDREGASLTEAYNLQVRDANDAPTAQDVYGLVEYSSVYAVEFSELVAASGAKDEDGDSVQLVSISGAVQGSMYWNPYISTVIFTPAAYAIDGGSFNFTLSDGRGGLIERTMHITTDPNRAPTFIDIDNVVVTENTPGAIIGTMKAIDPNPDDIHHFRIIDNDNRFDIVNGNVLALREGVSLDFEHQEKPYVTVTATDSGGREYTRTIWFEIQDVNEAQTLIGVVDGHV